jgi:hypothetical protein
MDMPEDNREENQNMDAIENIGHAHAEQGHGMNEGNENEKAEDPEKNRREMEAMKRDMLANSGLGDGPNIGGASETI